MHSKYYEKIKASFKNKILIDTVLHALRNRWPFWIIKNDRILRYHLQDRAYRKLRRKYGKMIQYFSSSDIKINKKNEFEKIIWFSWLQGVENAPMLVQRCYESAVQNESGYKVVVITEDNLNDLVDIPDNVIWKWKKGIISHANFSDLVRISLLTQYGGLWMDSTVLLTEREIPDYITNSPFFMYKALLDGSERISSSSWVISSQANNKILELTKKMMYDYWSNNNVAINYFVFHIFITLSAERYPDLWEKIPTFNNVSPHILQFEMLNKYDEGRYKQIRCMSPFHKLNYKQEGLTECPGSFYDVLINDGKYRQSRGVNEKY